MSTTQRQVFEKAVVGAGAVRLAAKLVAQQVSLQTVKNGGVGAQQAAEVARAAANLTARQQMLQSINNARADGVLDAP